MELANKCSICGAYNGHGLIGPYKEMLPCPEMSREELIEQLKQYYKSWREVSDKFHNRCISYQRNMWLWHGKYMLVKHENNKLRRKLYAKS